MAIEEAVTAFINPLVENEQFYFGTTPDGYDPHAHAEFVIGQFVGGESGIYVDGTLQSLTEGRLQLWVWGARYMEVAALARLLKKEMVALTETQPGIWRAVIPNGNPVDDYNESLKIHGKRFDLTIVYADPDAPLP